MADSTIPQLQEAAAEDVNDDFVFPVDSGTETYKLKISNLVAFFKSIANFVTSAMITDGAVTTAKIGDNQVTTAKLPNSAVTTAKIGDSQVTTAKIANGAVTTAKIGDSQVTGAKIASNTITAGNIAANAVGNSELASNAVMDVNIASNAAIDGSKILTATASRPGVISHTSQTIGGAKTWTGNNSNFESSGSANVIWWSRGNDRGTLWCGIGALGARDRQAIIMNSSGSSTAYFLGNDGNLRGGSTGNINLSGGLDGGTIIGTQSSDERLKKNIEPIPYGLPEILNLKPIRYERKGKIEIGFGAQTTMPIIPEAVYDTFENLNREKSIFDPDFAEEMQQGTLLAMDYSRITPVLVKAIQEQQTIIESLKSKIEALENGR